MTSLLTVELTRAVMKLQDHWADEVLRSGPRTEGWTLHMHPKTWYKVIAEAEVNYDSPEGLQMIRGRNEFLGIPVVLNPEWPEQSISLRWEQVVLG